MPAPILVAAGSVAGALCAALSVLIPGLHLYSMVTLAVLALNRAGQLWAISLPELLFPFLAGLIAGYALLSTVPAILLGAPDESAIFTVLPGRRYLLLGRGQEAVMITTFGSLASLFLLFPVAARAPSMLPELRTILSPHLHWMLWCIIAFMLLSEWPRNGAGTRSGISGLLDECRSTGAGLATFLMAGLLGLLLIYKTPLQSGMRAGNLAPAFAGIFTLPPLLMNIVTGTGIPAQRRKQGGPVQGIQGPGKFLSDIKGIVAGIIGGGFAAFSPAVTGGVGGFLAGRASCRPSDRELLLSQGAARTLYYLGGFLLFFVPGLHRAGGETSSLLSGYCSPSTRHDYFMVLAAIAFGGATACTIIIPCLRLVLYLIARFGYRSICIASAAIIAGGAVAIGGTFGLLVLLTGAGIGLIPEFSDSPRANCLGLVLLPAALVISGHGPAVATALGFL